MADSRNGDWKKGQFGTIEKVIATPPQNTNTIYIIYWKTLIDVKRVWATEKDVVPDEQMTIFDVLATDEASSDNS